MDQNKLSYPIECYIRLHKYTIGAQFMRSFFKGHKLLIYVTKDLLKLFKSPVESDEAFCMHFVDKDNNHH